MSTRSAALPGDDRLVSSTHGKLDIDVRRAPTIQLDTFLVPMGPFHAVTVNRGLPLHTTTAWSEDCHPDCDG